MIVQKFDKLVEDLATEMLAAASRFISRSDLGLMSTERLNQMSTDLNDVALELLCFGADCWPDMPQDQLQSAEIVPFPKSSVA